jgi:hypothetical protein
MTKKNTRRKKRGKTGKNPNPHGRGHTYTKGVGAGGAAINRPLSAIP